MTAVVVEDGTGKINADSYISVADAATYHADRGNDAAWDALNDQDAALRLATQHMQEMYRLRWAGSRTSISQALDWPRAMVPLPDAPFAYGYGSLTTYVPNNVIPIEVKQACAELALRTGSGPLAPDLSRATVSEEVGPIKVTYDKSSAEYTRFRAVDALLTPYLTGGGSFMRLGRA